MLRGNHTMIVGALYLLPVLLGLIGVGALLHVVRAAAGQEDALAALDQQQSEELRLNATIEELESQIEDIRQKLARLEEARARKSELERLREELERLDQQRSTQQHEIEKLAARSAARAEDRGALDRQRAEARRRLQDLEREVAVQKSEIDRQRPDEGYSLDDLQARIASLANRLQQQQRLNEQAQKDLDDLQQVPEDSTIRVDEIRGTADWPLPPNPLYVECDGRGVVLQPENVRLPAQLGERDQERFVEIARKRQYVLLLIRPDGYDSFWQYRPLLVESSVMYGYEPISQHGRVVYPERGITQ